jgi:DNA repair photolyase
MNDLDTPDPVPQPRSPVDLWHATAVIALNNFIFKSLSNWAFNLAVGCCHACRFCYVPSAATIKQGPQLARYGVTDPDAEWGSYVLFRLWDESMFLASLRAAERTPPASLKPDGNRAVMYCSTTDPYQVIHHPDPTRQRELSAHARFLVRRSLELIRDQSTLNVRILTRSPLAREDFDLFRSFGHRLMFGMSLPTLRNDLSKVYEPKAPAPTQRLAALRAAKEAGLHVYVAMAPTYPECDEADLRATLSAVAELQPLTIFNEPINIRAENVARIEAHAAQLGIAMKTDVFATREAWQDYAIGSLQTVQRLATELGLAERLHSWPDKSLGNRAVLQRVPDPAQFHAWLQQSWSRISEWPSAAESNPNPNPTPTLAHFESSRERPPQPPDADHGEFREDRLGHAPTVVRLPGLGITASPWIHAPATPMPSASAITHPSRMAWPNPGRRNGCF